MKIEIRGVCFLGVLLSIICLGLAGCGSSSSDDAPAPAAVTVVDCSSVTSAATVTATSLNTFSPSNVTISVNDMVRWISDSTTYHTVTSGTAPPTDGKFDEPLTSKGSSVCLKFNEAGTYNYYCTPHYSMGMIGVVTVQ